MPKRELNPDLRERLARIALPKLVETVNVGEDLDLDSILTQGIELAAASYDSSLAANYQETRAGYANDDDWHSAAMETLERSLQNDEFADKFGSIVAAKSADLITRQEANQDARMDLAQGLHDEAASRDPRFAGGIVPRVGGSTPEESALLGQTGFVNADGTGTESGAPAPQEGAPPVRYDGSQRYYPRNPEEMETRQDLDGLDAAIDAAGAFLYHTIDSGTLGLLGLVGAGLQSAGVTENNFWTEDVRNWDVGQFLGRRSQLLGVGENTDKFLGLRAGRAAEVAGELAGFGVNIPGAVAKGGAKLAGKAVAKGVAKKAATRRTVARTALKEAEKQIARGENEAARRTLKKVLGDDDVVESVTRSLGQKVGQSPIDLAPAAATRGTQTVAKALKEAGIDVAQSKGWGTARKVVNYLEATESPAIGAKILEASTKYNLAGRAGLAAAGGALVAGSETDKGKAVGGALLAGAAAPTAAYRGFTWLAERYGKYKPATLLFHKATGAFNAGAGRIYRKLAGSDAAQEFIYRGTIDAVLDGTKNGMRRAGFRSLQRVFGSAETAEQVLKQATTAAMDAAKAAGRQISSGAARTEAQAIARTGQALGREVVSKTMQESAERAFQGALFEAVEKQGIDVTNQAVATALRRFMQSASRSFNSAHRGALTRAYEAIAKEGAGGGLQRIGGLIFGHGQSGYLPASLRAAAAREAGLVGAMADPRLARAFAQAHSHVINMTALGFTSRFTHGFTDPSVQIGERSEYSLGDRTKAAFKNWFIQPDEHGFKRYTKPIFHDIVFGGLGFAWGPAMAQKLLKSVGVGGSGRSIGETFAAITGARTADAKYLESLMFDSVLKDVATNGSRFRKGFSRILKRPEDAIERLFENPAMAKHVARSYYQALEGFKDRNIYGIVNRGGRTPFSLADTELGSEAAINRVKAGLKEAYRRLGRHRYQANLGDLAADVTNIAAGTLVTGLVSSPEMMGQFFRDVNQHGLGAVEAGQTDTDFYGVLQHMLFASLAGRHPWSNLAAESHQYNLSGNGKFSSGFQREINRREANHLLAIMGNIDPRYRESYAATNPVFLKSFGGDKVGNALDRSLERMRQTPTEQEVETQANMSDPVKQSEMLFVMDVLYGRSKLAGAEGDLAKEFFGLAEEGKQLDIMGEDAHLLPRLARATEILREELIDQGVISQGDRITPGAINRARSLFLRTAHQVMRQAAAEAIETIRVSNAFTELWRDGGIRKLRLAGETDALVDQTTISLDSGESMTGRELERLSSAFNELVEIMADSGVGTSNTGGRSIGIDPERGPVRIPITDSVEAMDRRQIEEAVQTVNNFLESSGRRDEIKPVSTMEEKRAYVSEHKSAHNRLLISTLRESVAIFEDAVNRAMGDTENTFRLGEFVDNGSDGKTIRSSMLKELFVESVIYGEVDHMTDFILGKGFFADQGTHGMAEHIRIEELIDSSIGQFTSEEVSRSAKSGDPLTNTLAIEQEYNGRKVYFVRRPEFRQFRDAELYRRVTNFLQMLQLSGKVVVAEGDSFTMGEDMARRFLVDSTLRIKKPGQVDAITDTSGVLNYVERRLGIDLNSNELAGMRRRDVIRRRTENMTEQDQMILEELETAGGETGSTFISYEPNTGRRLVSLPIKVDNYDARPVGEVINRWNEMVKSGITEKSYMDFVRETGASIGEMDYREVEVFIKTVDRLIDMGVIDGWAHEQALDPLASQLQRSALVYTERGIDASEAGLRDTVRDLGNSMRRITQMVREGETIGIIAMKANISEGLNQLRNLAVTRKIGGKELDYGQLKRINQTIAMLGKSRRASWKVWRRIADELKAGQMGQDLKAIYDKTGRIARFEIDNRAHLTTLHDLAMRIDKYVTAEEGLLHRRINADIESGIGTRLDLSGLRDEREMSPSKVMQTLGINHESPAAQEASQLIGEHIREAVEARNPGAIRPDYIREMLMQAAEGDVFIESVEAARDMLYGREALTDSQLIFIADSLAKSESVATGYEIRHGDNVVPADVPFIGAEVSTIAYESPGLQSPTTGVRAAPFAARTTEFTSPAIKRIADFAGVGLLKGATSLRGGRYRSLSELPESAFNTLVQNIRNGIVAAEPVSVGLQGERSEAVTINPSMVIPLVEGQSSNKPTDYFLMELPNAENRGTFMAKLDQIIQDYQHGAGQRARKMSEIQRGFETLIMIRNRMADGSDTPVQDLVKSRALNWSQVESAYYLLAFDSALGRHGVAETFGDPAVVGAADHSRLLKTVFSRMKLLFGESGRRVNDTTAAAMVDSYLRDVGISWNDIPGLHRLEDGTYEIEVATGKGMERPEVDNPTGDGQAFSGNSHALNILSLLGGYGVDAAAPQGSIKFRIDHVDQNGARVSKGHTVFDDLLAEPLNNNGIFLMEMDSAVKIAAGNHKMTDIYRDGVENVPTADRVAPAYDISEGTLVASKRRIPLSSIPIQSFVPNNQPTAAKSAQESNLATSRYSHGLWEMAYRGHTDKLMEALALVGGTDPYHDAAARTFVLDRRGNIRLPREDSGQNYASSMSAMSKYLHYGGTLASPKHLGFYEATLAEIKSAIVERHLLRGRVQDGFRSPVAHDPREVLEDGEAVLSNQARNHYARAGDMNFAFKATAADVEVIREMAQEITGKDLASAELPELVAEINGKLWGFGNLPNLFNQPAQGAPPREASTYIYLNPKKHGLRHLVDYMARGVGNDTSNSPWTRVLKNHPGAKDLITEALQDIVFDHQHNWRHWARQIAAQLDGVSREDATALLRSMARMERLTATQPQGERQNYGGTLDALRSIGGHYDYRSRLSQADGTRTGTRGDFTLGLVAEFHRNPATEPNDTMPMVALDILTPEFGNQVRMQHRMAARIAKADYDYDNFDIALTSHSSSLSELLRTRGMTGGNLNVAGESTRPWRFEITSDVPSANPVRQWAVAKERGAAGIGIVMNTVAKMSMIISQAPRLEYREGGYDIRIEPNPDIFPEGMDPMAALQQNGFEAIRTIGNLQNLATDIKSIIPPDPRDLNTRGYYIGNIMSQLFRVSYRRRGETEWRSDSFQDNTGDGGYAEYRYGKRAVQLIDRLTRPVEGIMSLTKGITDETGSRQRPMKAIEDQVHRWLDMVDGVHKSPSEGFKAELIARIMDDKIFGTASDRHAMAESLDLRMDYRDTHLVQRLARELGRMGSAIGSHMTAQERLRRGNARQMMAMVEPEQATAHIAEREFRKDRRVLPGPKFDGDLFGAVSYVNERIGFIRETGYSEKDHEMERVRDHVKEVLERDRIEEQSGRSSIDADVRLARNRDGNGGILANLILQMREMDLRPREMQERVSRAVELQREIHQDLKNALRGFADGRTEYVDMEHLQNRINEKVQNFMTFYGRNGNGIAAGVALLYPVARGLERMGTGVAPSYHKINRGIIDAIYNSIEVSEGGAREFSRLVAEAMQVATAFENGSEGAVDQALYNIILHAAKDPTNFPMHMTRMTKTRWGRKMLRRDLARVVYRDELNAGFDMERMTNENGDPLVMPDADPNVRHRTLTASRYIQMSAAMRMSQRVDEVTGREKINPYFSGLNQISQQLRRGLGPLGATGSAMLSIYERPDFNFETMAYSLLGEAMNHQQQKLRESDAELTREQIDQRSFEQGRSQLRSMIRRMSTALGMADKGLIERVEVSHGNHQLEAEAMSQRIARLLREGC